MEEGMEMQPAATRIQRETNPESRQSDDFWLRLDNAAKIYPAVQSEELTSVFRLSAVMKERIRIGPFLKAVNLLEQRFPYYKMKLHKGFFWYYLQYVDENMTVKPDGGAVCRSFEKQELLFRILVQGNKVSVEFSHILADGAGAFEFLKSLLMTYLETCDLIIPSKTAFHRPEEKPAEEEYEDAFSKYVQANLPSPLKIPKSFHLPFDLRTIPRYRALSFLIPVGEIMATAKTYGVTLTVYLVAVYLYALQRISNNPTLSRKHMRRRIFRIQVPVNLRRMYPSKTMRNFTLFVTPEIDLRLGQYTFEEIIKTVYHHMQLETDRKLINKIISRNVSAERNILLKSTPLFIKSLILHFTYKIAGTSRYSGVITNLGKASFGSGADKHIDYLQFIPPPPNKTLKVNCGVIGFDSKLVLSFGNITTSRELEREFISVLTGDGVHVKHLDG